MSSYVIYQVDAFTTELFKGNPAGVVLNAEGLDERAMLSIARELNNSETAFVFDGQSGQYDVHVRFFTPTHEVPICGHATIAAHYVFAKEHEMENGRLLQKTGAGILPVDIRKVNDEYIITMTQGMIEFGNILNSPETAILFEALNINEEDIDSSSPIQIVSTGHSKVMIPLKKKTVLDSLKPDSGLLTELSDIIQCNGFFPFTFDVQENGVLTAGRMFAPRVGISEDPVTGNANGPLGAYLVQYGLLKVENGKAEFLTKQGETIGRKGYVRVQVTCEGQVPTLVKIEGRARIVFKTCIEL